MDRGAWWATVHRVTKELEMTEVTENARIYIYIYLSIYIYIYIYLSHFAVHLKLT